MYTLYIGNKNYSSWSLRPWALLRELNIPFTEKLMVFDHGGSWESFREFSPTGQVPCLVDGDTVVWDSLGITEYVAERHEGVWPSDRPARAWARCVAAEMHSSFGVLRDRCTMNVGIRVRLHEIPPTLARDIARLNELWTEGLKRFGGPFLAGKSFTAVDAFFTAVAFRVQTYDLKLDKDAAAYAARLLALPSLQAWQTAALTETWREPDHEAEAIRAGTWLEDRRAKPA
jgi:glutathione S-transferase